MKKELTHQWRPMCEYSSVECKTDYIIKPVVLIPQMHRNEIQVKQSAINKENNRSVLQSEFISDVFRAVVIDIIL